MINLKQVKEILKVINPNNPYTDGIFFDTCYLNLIDKDGNPYYMLSFKKYNNNLIIVCETFDSLFIIGSKRIIKNIMNKYNFESFNSVYSYFFNYSYLNKFKRVKETDIMTFSYFEDGSIDKNFIDFIENDLKDLNDSEKLFIEMEV